MKWQELSAMVDSAVDETHQVCSGVDVRSGDDQDRMSKQALWVQALKLRVQCEIAGSLDSISADIKALRKSALAIGEKVADAVIEERKGKR